jgi:hypothetical protein
VDDVDAVEQLIEGRERVLDAQALRGRPGPVVRAAEDARDLDAAYPSECVEVRRRGEAGPHDPDTHAIGHGPMLAVRAPSTRAGTLGACRTWS